MKKVSLTTNKIKLETKLATLKTRGDGKEYLVVPAVPIKEGVLNQEFVPAEEIGVYVEAWNGLPIPLGHPKDEDGEFVSAQNPDIVDNICIGNLWNATFKNGVLRAEAWIDVQKCQTLGGDAFMALERLRTGYPVEGSTGYFRDVEQAEGVYNGKEYFSIARNIRPDHYAILLNEEGACSWKDGCGLPRVNKAITVNEDITDHSDTAFVALAVPAIPSACLLLSVADLYPPEVKLCGPYDYHLTLSYLGDVTDLPDEEAISARLAQVAQGIAPIKARANGFAIFVTPEDKTHDVLVALIDSPYLPFVWQTVRDGLFNVGASPVQTHGFIPHISLAYIPKPLTPGLRLPNPLSIPIKFDQMFLEYSENYTPYPLVGEANLDPLAAQNKQKEKSYVANVDPPKSTPQHNSEIITMNRDDLIKYLSEKIGVPAGGFEQFTDEDLGKLYESYASSAEETAPEETAENGKGKDEEDPKAMEDYDEEEDPKAMMGGDIVHEMAKLGALLAEYGGIDAIRAALTTNAVIANEVEKNGGAKSIQAMLVSVRGLAEVLNDLGGADKLKELTANLADSKASERTRHKTVVINAGFLTEEDVDKMDDATLSKIASAFEADTPVGAVRPEPQTRVNTGKGKVTHNRPPSLLQAIQASKANGTGQ